MSERPSERIMAAMRGDEHPTLVSLSAEETRYLRGMLRSEVRFIEGLPKAAAGESALDERDLRIVKSMMGKVRER